MIDRTLDFPSSGTLIMRVLVDHEYLITVSLVRTASSARTNFESFI